MPNLPNITGKQAVKAFSKAGFHIARISGSHHIMKKEGHEYLLTVPVHTKQSVKPGTLGQLIRASGMTVNEFIDLL